MSVLARSSVSSAPSYFDALCWAMTMLAEHDEVVFLGQGVGVGGTTMSQTLEHVPNYKRIEMPVAEDMQMGMAIGMALEGLIPVCIFPRWNFLLLAANQLINHLDRLPLYSAYRPKVIIRTAIPSNKPFDPGPQHDDDFSDAFARMARTVRIMKLRSPTDIVRGYERALNVDYPTLLVEYTEHYKNARASAD